MAQDQPPPQPPQAPTMERRVLLTPLQRWGLPLLAALPVLALTGLLGVTTASLTASEEPLEVTVEFPDRARKGVAATLTTSVRNTGSGPLADVVVGLDRSYLESFEEVFIEPGPDAIASDAYLFELGDLAPGASRIVNVTLTPESYGRRHGTATVEADGLTTSASVEFTTFTFP